jgi:hypothetical protein
MRCRSVPQPDLSQVPGTARNRPLLMLSVSVSDIIHLIQHYYHTSSYDNAATDVETFRLEPLRGKYPSALMQGLIAVP